VKSRLSKWTRRELLLRAGAGAALLPFVPVLASDVEAAGPPRRLMIMYHPHGFPLQTWRPTGTNGALQYGALMKPFEKYKDKTLLIEGVDNLAGIGGAGDSHNKNITCTFTGTETAGLNSAGGPSLDQVIAPTIAGTTKFQSLQYGALATNNSISYAGRARKLSVEANPASSFDRLFKDFKAPTATPGAPAPAAGPDPAILRAQKKSVLDFVQGSITSLRGRVGASDRARLDAHAEAIRGLEMEIASLGSAPVANAKCEAPKLESNPGNGVFGNFHVVGKLQMQVMAAAMACDLTRVGTMQWGSGGNDQLLLSALGVSTEYHRMAHQCELDNLPLVDQMTKVCAYFAQNGAELLDRIAGIPEAGTNMLDNTLFLWMSGFSNGGHVWTGGSATVIAGANLGVKGGRYLKVNGIATNDVFISVAKTLGVDLNTFGNPKYVKGPIAGWNG
jgi:hypothetical protein